MQVREAEENTVLKPVFIGLRCNAVFSSNYEKFGGRRGVVLGMLSFIRGHSTSDK